jgi:hypothetical protein
MPFFSHDKMVRLHTPKMSAACLRVNTSIIQSL